MSCLFFAVIFFNMFLVLFIHVSYFAILMEINKQMNKLTLKARSTLGSFTEVDSLSNKQKAFCFRDGSLFCQLEAWWSAHTFQTAFQSRTSDFFRPGCKPSYLVCKVAALPACWRGQVHSWRRGSSFVNLHAVLHSVLATWLQYCILAGDVKCILTCKLVVL